MKKALTSILLFIPVFLLTACGSQNNELDILTEYLENSKFYNCKGNICSKEEKSGTVSTISEYNFETSSYKSEVIASSTGETVSVIEYNWLSDIATSSDTTFGDEIIATYNFVTKTYDCQNNTLDQTTSTTQCESIKITMEALREELSQNFSNSGSKYFTIP